MKNKTDYIFLDFDGVMDTGYQDAVLTKEGLPNTDKYGLLFDPESVRNLYDIIDKTKALIVVTSTWKQFMTLEEIQEMWKFRKLPGVVVGVTPNLGNDRGREVAKWLEQHKDEIHKYAIIDDMNADCFQPDQTSNLFIVNPYLGIDEDTAERIVNHLKR